MRKALSAPKKALDSRNCRTSEVTRSRSSGDADMAAAAWALVGARWVAGREASRRREAYAEQISPGAAAAMQFIMQNALMATAGCNRLFTG